MATEERTTGSRVDQLSACGCEPDAINLWAGFLIAEWGDGDGDQSRLGALSPRFKDIRGGRPQTRIIIIPARRPGLTIRYIWRCVCVDVTSSRGLRWQARGCVSMRRAPRPTRIAPAPSD